MAFLIAGPSSAGKSTFIQSEERSVFGADYPNIAFGFQIEQGFPADSLVHYNILHQALAFGGDYAAANARWDFATEPVFARIVSSGLIEQCIVLVAPIAELIERMESRTEIEFFTTVPYDAVMWQDIVRQIDLFRVYELLFASLDRCGIPYRVLLSSARQPQRFTPSDRVFVHANLRGRRVEVPPIEDVRAVIAHPGSHYQTVTLPHGLVTAVGGYDHLGDGRQSTFDRVLPCNLDGASILDIGCALGDLLFRAERLGAIRLVGLEMRADRYDAACSIARLLRSSAVINNSDFVETRSDEMFDHVYALNVIHHVHDFHKFLVRAAAATRRSLTLEFPTLDDEKFRGLYGLSLSQTRPLNDLPLVGVSGAAADQSYVYTPYAIQRTIDEIGGFVRCELAESRVRGRVIMTLHRS